MTTSSVRFGRYEILATLGQGGFATVYRAWDPLLSREVALKALLPHHAVQSDLRERFLAEAQALAALRHPNIVMVHDVGEANGQPFFAMEVIEGQTLQQLLGTQQRLALDEVLDILEPLASAVDYLHGAGIVHRDIKAANIVRDVSGRVVLMDFGIARLSDRMQVTQLGASLGTAETMAPEQVRGDIVGPAADIYALGILTYQMLAGRLPFVGDTAYVLHAQAYEEPPDLEGLRPGLPAATYRALEWALMKDPERRPEDALLLVDALAGLDGLPNRPTPIGTGTHNAPDRRVLFVAGVFVALLAVAGTLAGASRRHHSIPSPPTVQASVTATAASLNPTPSSPDSSPSPTAAIATPSVLEGIFTRGQIVRANLPDNCVNLRNSPSLTSTAAACVADGQNLRVLDGPIPADGHLWWQAGPWNGSGGPSGWAAQDLLVPSPNCDTRRDAPSCERSAATAPPTIARTVAPPPPPSSGPSGTLTGDWTLTDHIRYGPDTGHSFDFRIKLTQRGTQVDGTGDLTISGQLDGRTLRAHYSQLGRSGDFIWTVTTDGTRFEGAFTNTIGNGGNSYGKRASGSVSGAVQATVFVVGPGLSGDRFREGDLLYICYTVSKPSHVRLVGVVSGSVVVDENDNGTGDCVGPYTADLRSATPDGNVTYRIEMKEGDNLLTQSTTTLSVVR